jgi:hypothetical protein
VLIAQEFMLIDLNAALLCALWASFCALILSYSASAATRAKMKQTKNFISTMEYDLVEERYFNFGRAQVEQCAQRDFLSCQKRFSDRARSVSVPG